MNIKLMYFSKKKNSTKRPNISSVGYDSFDGKIRDNCSVVNPVISFNFGTTSNVPSWNYALIDKLDNRLYFINDWTFEDGLWVASMTEDCLASWEDEIGRSSQYVLRSSSEKNGYISDSRYPSSSENSTTNVFFEDGNFNYGDIGGLTYSDLADTALYNGRFVLSINNGNPQSASTTSYYELSGSGMYSLLHKIFDTTPSGFGDLPSGLAKQLANPIQYINHIFWYPFYVCPVSVPVYPPQGITIPLGYYSFSGIDGREIDPKVVAKSACGGVIDIPKHPQSTTRGAYMNLSPHSNYTLWIDPFGAVQLDSTKMIDSTRLSIAWVNDISTGIGNLYVSTNEGGIIAKTRAKTGVELAITQNVTDVGGVLTSGLKAASSIMSGNYIGAGAGVVSDVMNAIIPQSTTVGGDGGFTIWGLLVPRLQAQFINQVSRDNDKFGCPLCATRTLNTLTGYCQCEEAKITSTNMLGEETNIIENYLNSGVYLE